MVSDTGQRKNGYIIWLCACDCGGEIRLDTRTLQRETILDCGCISKLKPCQRDLTGQRFGRLVAVAPTQNRSAKGDVIWHCRCECGGEAFAATAQLIQGYKKSCGCLSRPPLKAYEGKLFGQLTVIEYAGKQNGMHRWRCRCSCGKETVVGQTLLQSGKTKSCGCLQAAMANKNMKYVEGTSVTRLEKADDRLIRTNTSGHNGIYQNRKTQKWIAQIGFKGKNYYLGTYHKFEDAVRAREQAEKRIHGEFLAWYYDTYRKEK